ncbi:MAG: helix-turn-helix domain-containing protein [Candidatus Bathyarchaeota archaeon]
MTSVSHTQAIALLLKGYSITEIAEMLEVSRTTIYNRRKDFLDYAGEEGLQLAAERYEVEETFEELMNLASELKLNETSVEEARKGSKIVELLDSMNVEDVESFILEIINKAQESDISGEEITHYAIELKRLEEQEDKSYTQLVLEIQERKLEFLEVEKNLRNLREQIEHVKTELEQELELSEATLERLETYVNTRNSLEDKGVSLEDFETLEKLIVNFREHEFNVDEIIEFFGATLFSRERFDRNNKENERLEERNTALRKENDSQEERLEKNLVMASTVKSLLEVKINPDDILEIVQTVTDMTQILGLSEEEALNRFIMDVKTQYKERSGYIFQLEELNRLQKAYQEKNSMLKEQMAVLEEVLEDRKHAVESIKRMETLEIDDAELVEWGRLLKDLEYDLSTFRTMVSKLGGLPEYTEEKTRHISALEAKENELQASVDNLREELAAIQETLSLVREIVMAETSKITEAVETFEEYFASPETGFKARSTRIVDDIVENLTDLLNNTQREWSSDLEMLDDNVEKVVEETSRILANAYAGGRIVGRFHALEPIHKILRDDPVSITEGTIGVITMLTYIKIWFRKNYSEEHTEAFDLVIQRLMAGLGDVY